VRLTTIGKRRARRAMMKRTARQFPDRDLALAALDSMPHGVAVFDRDLRLVARNNEYLKIYGLPPDVARPGASLRDILEVSVRLGNHPGRTADEVEQVLRARLQVRNRRVTVSERSMEGGRTIRVTISPIRGGAWVFTHEDVSEIKRYIEALREREEEIMLQNATFDFAVRNLRQGMCMFDADRRLAFSNPQYADMYNIPRERIVPGMSIEEVLEERAAAGNHPIGGNEAFVTNRLALVGENDPAAFVVEMDDGRAISILHQPLIGGGWVATHWEITKERQSEAQIRHLARHDALTDLPNRILLREHMEDLQARAGAGEIMAVLCVDLDHFKAVNDTLGHSIGDETLKEVAARLLANVRETDVCARLGGDEFAILHGPLSSPQEASVLAARIIAAIAEPFDVQDHRFVIGASVGIAVAPGDGCEAEGLLKAADLACYRAKHSGRGTFHFFEKSMDRAVRKRRQLELGLRSALAGDQLTLNFQPLFNLENDMISGAEALLRWRHPQQGNIPPDEFIPVAEDTGMINRIGEWVLRQACGVAAEWPDDMRVAVNLSAVQFKAGSGLAETVVSALAASGLKPQRLELEITESVLLFQMEGVLKTLHQLQDLGVRICMDDFGTGYSSLSYLRAFPFDKIKIDRTFVQDAVSRDGSAIISAVVGLGRTLGMSITAEGVETAEQLMLVKRQGCDEAQGFLLSKPLPQEALARFLRGRPSALPVEEGRRALPARARAGA
jgi:diguanylate cyclase (GGDEF)-like protein